MNILPPNHPDARGIVSTAGVITVAFAMIAGLTFAFRSHIRSLEAQTIAQVKVDYVQKEDAILQALLHLVPNRAIGAMRNGSQASASDHSWEAIFGEAIDLANAENAINSDLYSAIGIDNLISANTGDTSLGNVSDLVAAVVEDGYLVNAGNTGDPSLLFHPEVGDRLPAPLTSNAGVYQLDREYPLVTFSKNHSTGWTKGINLDPADYPRYNQYRYPNIRFGYAKPGDLFMAKRNWWAFSLTFGNNDTASSGVPAIRKNYLLSIYEVPSQLPLSASGRMSVGQHEDGTAWQNTDFAGGVFAGALETEGTVSVANGLFSARRSMNLSSDTTVRGNRIEANFDALGVRELREAETMSNFYEASLGGNVGRVVFVPINRGQDFLKLKGDGSSSDRISPTGWEYYSRGARQAQMRIRIRKMQAIDEQIPTEVRFYYRNTANKRVYKTYTRGVNWPADGQTGGTDIPFQTTQLSVGRQAMVFHLDRLPAFLASLGDAADVTVNNSILIYPDASQATVSRPNYPSRDGDLAVSLRGGVDMSAFTSGFSMVTDMRLYLAESLNTVTIAAPPGSGLPVGAEFLPPVSLFAPEKRFGESATFNHPVKFAGQLNTLKTGETESFRPLDLKSGRDDSVNPNMIEADLAVLMSPAELPPVHQMNWLITIEEIFTGPVSGGSGLGVGTPDSGWVDPGTGEGGTGEDVEPSSYAGSTPEQARDFVEELAEVYVGSSDGLALETVSELIEDGIQKEESGDPAGARTDYLNARNGINQAVNDGLISDIDGDAINSTLQAWANALTL